MFRQHFKQNADAALFQALTGKSKQQLNREDLYAKFDTDRHSKVAQSETKNRTLVGAEKLELAPTYKAQEYEDSPLGFIKDMIPEVELTLYQETVLTRLQLQIEGKDKYTARVRIDSTKKGVDDLVAWINLWFLTTRKNGRGVIPLRPCSNSETLMRDSMSEWAKHLPLEIQPIVVEYGRWYTGPDNTVIRGVSTTKGTRGFTGMKSKNILTTVYAPDSLPNDISEVLSGYAAEKRTIHVDIQ